MQGAPDSMGWPVTAHLGIGDVTEYEDEADIGVPERVSRAVDGSSQQLTSNIRASEPPWPTRKRTHLEHFGHLAMYAGASGLRKTRTYLPAQVKRTPIQGLPLGSFAGFASCGWLCWYWFTGGLRDCIDGWMIFAEKWLCLLFERHATSGCHIVYRQTSDTCASHFLGQTRGEWPIVCCCDGLIVVGALKSRLGFDLLTTPQVRGAG